MAILPAGEAEPGHADGWAVVVVGIRVDGQGDEDGLGRLVVVVGGDNYYKQTGSFTGRPVGFHTSRCAAMTSSVVGSGPDHDMGRTAHLET